MLQDLATLLVPITEHGLVIIGVSIDAFGTILSGFGLLYQKLAHKEAELSGESKEYYRDPAWQAGFGIYVGGQCMVLCAMALCAQTVIACLNCLTMGVAVMGAGPILGERLSRGNMAGVGVLILALIWVVRNSPNTKFHLRISDVIANAMRFDFVTISLCCLAPVSLAMIWDYCCSYSRSRTRDAMIPKLEFELHWMTCVLVSATCAWFSTISAKALAGLFFSTTYYGDQQLFNSVAFLLLFPAILLMVANVHFLNLGLKRGSSGKVIPIYEALTVTGQVCMGSAFYGEFPKEFGEKMWFLVRVSAVVLGIIALAKIDQDAAHCDLKTLEAGTGEETAPLNKKPVTHSGGSSAAAPG